MVRPLSNDLRERAVRAVESGETIVAQGEPGDAYYVILSGEAEVWVTDPFTDETSRATVLGAGDGFGEEALLLEGNRTATVTMISPGRLLVLGQPDFDRLLKPGMVVVGRGAYFVRSSLDAEAPE